MSCTWEYQIVIKLNQRKFNFSPPFSPPPHHNFNRTRVQGQERHH